MTHRPIITNAAERKEKSESLNAGPRRLNAKLHGAAMPVPAPQEPETGPVVPAPAVEPTPDAQPETRPEKPQPFPSRYEGQVMAGESQEEFDQFAQRLYDHYLPYDDEERVLVGKLIYSRWLLKRRHRALDAVEAAIYVAQPDPAKWSEDHFKRLALADSYCEQAEECANRIQSRVDAFIQKRIDESRFQAKADIAYNNFILGRKRYEFSLWKAGLRPKTAADAEEEEAKPATKKVSVQ